MSFLLQDLDYLLLFDSSTWSRSFQTTQRNFISSKYDSNLLSTAAAYLSRNTNLQELLIRVSDDIEVIPFERDEQSMALWNLKPFRTVHPITSTIRQRSELEGIISEQGQSTKHEFEVMRVRSIRQVENPVSVRLERVLITDNCILFTTKDHFGGLIDNKDIVKISGVDASLDTYHLIESKDHGEFRTENSTSFDYSILTVNPGASCTLKGTVDDRTVIYHLKKKQQNFEISSNPSILFQEESFQGQISTPSLRTPSTPSGEEPGYIPDSGQQGQSSETRSSNEGIVGEILELPKYEQYPEIKSMIQQISPKVFIMNLVNEVGLEKVLRICVKHLFGLGETMEAFDDAIKDLEIKNTQIQLNQNNAATTLEIRNKQIQLNQNNAATTLEIRNEQIQLNQNNAVNTLEIGNKQIQLNQNNAVNTLEIRNERTPRRPNYAIKNLENRNKQMQRRQNNAVKNLEIQNAQTQLRQNEAIVDETWEVNEVPLIQDKIASSIDMVNRANRLLGISRSDPAPYQIPTVVNHQEVPPSLGARPAHSNKGQSSSPGHSHLTPRSTQRPLSFEEIVNLLKGSNQRHDARTLVLCHERREALVTQRNFLDRGVDAKHHKRGKLHALNFVQEVHGNFVLIVNSQVVLNIMGELEQDLFSFFTYVVEPVNLSTASDILTEVKRRFQQVEGRHTQWLRMYHNL